MQITQVPDTGHVHVRTVSNVDLQNVGRFRQRLFGVLTDSTTNMTLDVSQLDYINSWGLAVFVELDTSLMRSGGKLVVLNPSPRLCRLFKETRLDQIFSIVSNDIDAQVPQP